MPETHRAQCAPAASEPSHPHRSHERVRFVLETPEVHASEAVQAYIQQEIDRPTKLWVNEVVDSTREAEHVKLRTPEFVLLPDQNGHRRHLPRPPAPAGPDPLARPRRVLANWPRRAPTPHPSAPRRFNWLAIVTSPEVRSIRDLRAEHLPMLERMYRQCVEAIQCECRAGPEDIMVFANYPPSVYKLHFHFCAPFYQPAAYDAFRMHSLSAIINNLRVRGDYYAASTFQIPVHSNSELYRAIAAFRDLSDSGSWSNSSLSDDEYPVRKVHPAQTILGFTPADAEHTQP
jgi:hypothetical protein